MVQQQRFQSVASYRWQGLGAMGDGVKSFPEFASIFGLCVCSGFSKAFPGIEVKTQGNLNKGSMKKEVGFIANLRY